jgi:ecotropic viral integration site 5 protein
MLIKQKCKDEAAIIKDVDRTFPHLEYFEQGQGGYDILIRILKALAIHVHSVGYCQGINFLAAVVYLNMYSEEDTFWMMTYILKECHYEDLFAPGMEKFQLCCYQLDTLVKQNLPKLAYHFVKDSIIVMKKY